MKKAKFTSIIASLILFTVIFTSCKKYEEGPSLSLRSKKSRIAGEWTVVEQTVNGTNTLTSGTTITSTVNKDGTYKSTVTAGSFSITDEGKWEFTGDKESVTFTSNTAGSTAETYEILMLKNKEMKIRQVEGGNTTIIRYEAK